MEAAASRTAPVAAPRAPVQVARRPPPVVLEPPPLVLGAVTTRLRTYLESPLALRCIQTNSDVGSFARDPVAAGARPSPTGRATPDLAHVPAGLRPQFRNAEHHYAKHRLPAQSMEAYFAEAQRRTGDWCFEVERRASDPQVLLCKINTADTHLVFTADAEPRIVSFRDRRGHRQLADAAPGTRRSPGGAAAAANR